MDNKKIQEIMIRNEKNLSKYASLSKDAIRLEPIEEDIRPNNLHINIYNQLFC